MEESAVSFQMSLRYPTEMVTIGRLCLFWLCLFRDGAAKTQGLQPPKNAGTETIKYRHPRNISVFKNHLVAYRDSESISFGNVFISKSYFR
jgi:hypothetical protein